MSGPMRARVAAGAAGAPLGSILSIVEALTVALTEENEALRRGTSPIAYQSYNERKSHALLMLNRLAPTLPADALDGPFKTAVAELHKGLTLNKQLLGLQLQAAQAVSDMIVRAIRDGQSDGTYSGWPDAYSQT